MKSPYFHSIFWALLILLLSPLAVAHASPPPADSEYFCVLPFDYQQGQRDQFRPAAKRLSDCAFCDLFDALNDDEERSRSPRRKRRSTIQRSACCADQSAI